MAPRRRYSPALKECTLKWMVEVDYFRKPRQINFVVEQVLKEMKTGNTAIQIRNFINDVSSRTRRNIPIRGLVGNVYYEWLRDSFYAKDSGNSVPSPIVKRTVLRHPRSKSLPNVSFPSLPSPTPSDIIKRAKKNIRKIKNAATRTCRNKLVKQFDDMLERRMADIYMEYLQERFSDLLPQLLTDEIALCTGRLSTFGRPKQPIGEGKQPSASRDVSRNRKWRSKSEEPPVKVARSVSPTID